MKLTDSPSFFGFSADRSWDRFEDTHDRAAELIRREFNNLHGRRIIRELTDSSAANFTRVLEEAMNDWCEYRQQRRREVQSC